MKKLYRSESNKKVAGIIGGIGEYLDIDPVVLRLIWIFIMVATGVLPGVMAYFFGLLIVPKKLPHSR